MRNPRAFFGVSGVGQFCIFSIFFGSAWVPSADTTYPRYSRWFLRKKHFFVLRRRQACRTRLKTCWICCKCSSKVSEKIMMSSTYTKANLSSTGLRIVFIVLWKVASAFLSPKDMRRYSYCPQGNIKEVLGIESGCRGIP